MMAGQNLTRLLKSLSPRELDREVQRLLTDSLQELVAAVEPAVPREYDALQACVIDDFDVQQIECTDRECRVQLRFRASARHGVGADKELERITGRAEAVIDEVGWVRYRDVAFAEELAFVGHDLGGGD
jgi:hypothetical protein